MAAVEHRWLSGDGARCTWELPACQRHSVLGYRTGCGGPRHPVTGCTPCALSDCRSVPTGSGSCAFFSVRVLRGLSSSGRLVGLIAYTQLVMARGRRVALRAEPTPNLPAQVPHPWVSNGGLWVLGFMAQCVAAKKVSKPFRSRFQQFVTVQAKKQVFALETFFAPSNLF